MNVIILDVAPTNLSDADLTDRMEELENLVSTYGGLVVTKRLQKKDMPDYRTFAGLGKLDEVMALGDELGSELLIIGNILKPSQIYNINEHFRAAKSKMQAWDRIDLILKIFDLHAISPEAKLQIELASIRHMGPRIFGMGMELSRQGGGVGTVGIGETNTEIMKRHLRLQEQKIIERLKKHEKTRAEHRKARLRKDFKTVGVVGYTNAGKSSLMNALTHKWVLAENKLFATLGTSVGKMYLPATDGSYGKEVLINDTIGFIRDLPPELIRAFSSTLEDSVESELLLHVVDANDPKIADKIELVDTTLDRIGAKQKRLYVFNKVDLVSLERQEELSQKFSHLKPIFVSAGTTQGLDALKKHIQEELGLDLSPREY